jgi:hypothetical protein
MTTTSTTMYFYKGTTFPLATKGADFPRMINKFALDMIITGEKMGETRAKQIKDYFAQLDMMEKAMCDIQADMGVPETDADAKDQLEALEAELGQPQDKIQMMWCLNIAALLMMKALPNDDNNGTMTQTFIAGKKK